MENKIIRGGFDNYFDNSPKDNDKQKTKLPNSVRNISTTKINSKPMYERAHSSFVSGFNRQR